MIGRHGDDRANQRSVEAGERDDLGFGKDRGVMLANIDLMLEYYVGQGFLGR